LARKVAPPSKVAGREKVAHADDALTFEQHSPDRLNASCGRVEF
jgi:hypothetical protein